MLFSCCHLDRAKRVERSVKNHDIVEIPPLASLGRNDSEWGAQ